MIFRSNLTCPDLSPHFKLLVKPRGYSFGHDVPSDPDFDPECGYWTHDEAAILYHVARNLSGLDWLDIGCRFGWTAMHIAEAAGLLVCLDPELRFQAQQSRFEENTAHRWGQILAATHKTAAEYFALQSISMFRFDGFVIDADHDAPNPLQDAQGCVKLAKPTAVIMLHDFWGKPIQDAVVWLLDQGWKARIYWTPNGVACCWHGDFAPPDHEPDPRIKTEMLGDRKRIPDFDFARCS